MSLPSITVPFLSALALLVGALHPEDSEAAIR